jgi:hypothetical protein
MAGAASHRRVPMKEEKPDYRRQRSSLRSAN